MNNLLLFTLQATFYIYGAMGLVLSLKCLIYDDSSHNVFFISSALSFIIGYFLHFMLQNTFKLRYFLKIIFFSWILLILVSSIPFLSLIQELNLSSILFISTSLITTSGFTLNFPTYFQKYEALFIWSSIIQLMGGFFSIISFILIFHIFLNTQNKLIVFNKKIIIKFIIYYFLLYTVFFLILNFSLNDILNSFVMASAIISTGGLIGNNGNILGFYFSNNIFLIIYSFLLTISALILPLFLYLQNKKILKNYYIKIFKRSFFLIIILSFLFLFFTSNNFLNIFENIFLFISFITTSGILPNKLNNELILQQINPFFFIFLLIIIIGSFSGSSSGGLKLDKVSILFIKIKDELNKLAFRHKVFGVDLIKKGSDQKELNNLYALIAFGILIVICSILSLCIAGYSVFEAYTVSIAALTNTGEGFLYINNVILNENSNIFLILNFLMICGRFEIIGYLLIFQKIILKN